ncbi:GEM-like protein 5 [Acorus gramineus]|uniref:GEM-like protein 5 n=1 Tax=Acorus gramineus TaxID=55184 RepID=A0AAV9A691_ACOGR|nr:GEM-like protein 5 [Acorus gramineus]
MEKTNSSTDQNPAQPQPTEPHVLWGTKQMGAPSAPSAHPHNQEAALWAAKYPPGGAHDAGNPYTVMSAPVVKPAGSPLETVLDVFNTWTKNAESLANNIWHNLSTSHSRSEAAWGKLNLTAKAVTEGGFEPLYKQTFHSDPAEKLKKTFACYLSTSTGPVSGTLYLTNMNVAFCSDRPLSFTAPSGQEAWSYYKVLVPLGKMTTVSPVTLRENPPEKYLQLVTVDGHEFWFMGFVNYEKACAHLTEAVSGLATAVRATEGPVLG